MPRIRLEQNRHLDRLLPALLFLLVMLGTLGPDSYFLHFDTPTQHQNAADLIIGPCWGPSGKPAVTLLLGIFFWLGGINPWWEMFLLTLLGMLTFAAFHQLAAYFTESYRWAMLGTLWFLTLPSILYYTRIHLGYPLAFFLVGMLLQMRGRFGWAGVAFGMAPITHMNFLVPLAMWLGWSFLFYRGDHRVQNYLRLGAGLLVLPLILEFVRFLFLGDPLGWSRGLVGVVERHADPTYENTWLHIPVLVSYSNGWLNALLLGIGAAYPLVRRRARPGLADAVYLTGWIPVAAYFFWAGALHRELVPRMLTGLYPLLALSSTWVIMRLWETGLHRLKPSARRIVRLAGAAAIIVLIAFAFINHTLDAAAGSRTAYDTAEQVMIDAARADLPVRYFGNYHAAYFIAQQHGVETGINETSLDVITADRRAVLIFESKVGREHETLTALLNDPGFNLAGYERITTPHFSAYRPYLAEDARRQTAKFHELSQTMLPVRAPEAPTATLTILWPRHPEGTFTARHEPNQYIFHYTGGCATPQSFNQGNYYHLLAEKAGILWQQLRAGKLSEIWRLLVTWIRE